jgi:glycosyltransferase involved in cell wall biosynthesis
MFTNPKDSNIPADMASIPHPVIGYVGALQSIRLDIDILEHIALARPQWSVVLVGPEDEVFKASRLHSIPNVHFLGSKKGEELPAYINAFDVCLNPQLVNPVTIGNYPRKIDEYLAMGKPTLATKTPAMSIFAEHTYLAETKEDYVTYIERALAEDSVLKQNERRSFAASHTWENNVKEIYRAINTFIDKAGAR